MLVNTSCNRHLERLQALHMPLGPVAVPREQCELSSDIAIVQSVTAPIAKTLHLHVAPILADSCQHRYR